MKTINFLKFAIDFGSVAVDFLASFVAAVWRIFKTSVAAVWRVRGAIGSAFSTILLTIEANLETLRSRKV